MENKKTIFEENWFHPRTMHAFSRILSGDINDLKKIEDELISSLFWNLIEKKSEGDFVDNFSGLLGYILSNKHLSYSQIFQDLWVLYLKNEKKNGFFIEFGACDGIRHSNTYILEKQYDWKGILAEPNPYWNENINQNRNCEISRNCILGVDGEEVEFKAVIDNQELSHSTSINPSDIHAKNGNRNNHEIFKVSSMKLETLLETYQAPVKIDYLSIDVEGAELEILNNFDFSKYFFDILTVENSNQDQDERLKIRNLMKNNDYRLLYEGFTRWDDLYLHKSFLKELTLN